jgi:thiamine transport system permease protein
VARLGFGAVARRRVSSAKAASRLLALAWIALAVLPLAALVARVAPADYASILLRLAARHGLLQSLLFGLLQAGGSLVVALAVGLPGAWLVARYKFPGRGILRAFAVIPFCMPPILVALGFVLYYGRNGYLNRFLEFAFGLENPPVDLLYSFFGLCLVHGFYNFPLVLDLVGSAWQGLPSTRSEAARSLGAGRTRAFLTATLPSLAPALAEAGSLAFLFSFFSFVVVMIFGPLGASTPETEIYRLLRFEGDFGSASLLALAQSLVALGAIAFLSLAARGYHGSSTESGEGREMQRPGLAGTLGILVYAAVLAFFFLAPLVSLGIESFVERRGFIAASRFSLSSWQGLIANGNLGRSLAATLVTALPASILATAAGLALGAALRRSRALFDTAASLPLAISGVITAAGWHLVFPEGNIGIVILIQALTALPFSLRTSTAALDALVLDPGLAARSLGAGRFRALLEVEIPVILPMIFSSAAFSFSLAAGDATTPLVLGLPDFQPLPLLVYRLTGAYRYSEACAAGLVLAALTGVVFYFKGRGEGHA